MEYLLDTHVLLWTLYDKEMVTDKLNKLYVDGENKFYYSTASLWEIEIKHNKFPDKFPYTAKETSDACLDSDIENMPVFNKHIFQLESIKNQGNKKHNNPFDLILLAQAKRMGAKLITHDHAFEYYDDNLVEII